MDPGVLNHRLTADERRRFERDGFLTIPDAVPAEMVDRLTAIVDRQYQHALREGEATPDTAYERVDVVGLDPLLLELLDWPRTFPKVWDILGWNISLFHSHLNVTPPSGARDDQSGLWSWHQDNGRLNTDLQLRPVPRISVKLAYYLSDTSEPRRGNTYVVPGSHRSEEKPRTSDRDHLLEGATPLCCGPGSVALFDQRIWHTASPNDSEMVRKVIFLSYGFRWLRPMDRMLVEHLAAGCDPIRQQLLNIAVSYHHGISNRYWPVNDDVPLQHWLREHADTDTNASP